MARSTVKVVVHHDAVRELMRNTDLVSGVEDIAAACNAESSWGGYDSEVEDDGIRARGRVWAFDNRNDEARDNRMIRNLDRGAP